MFEKSFLPGVNQFRVPFQVNIQFPGNRGLLVQDPLCAAWYTPSVAPGHWDVACFPYDTTKDRLSTIAKSAKLAALIECNNPQYPFAAGETCQAPMPTDAPTDGA